MKADGLAIVPGELRKWRAVDTGVAGGGNDWFPENLFGIVLK